MQAKSAAISIRLIKARTENPAFIPCMAEKQKDEKKTANGTPNLPATRGSM